jgi:hypothetical protein
MPSSNQLKTDWFITNTLSVLVPQNQNRQNMLLAVMLGTAILKILGISRNIRRHGQIEILGLSSLHSAKLCGADNYFL